jgi:hypothetical protein
MKRQSKVLNIFCRTPVFLQNSPKKRPFLMSILRYDSIETALNIAAEALAPVFWMPVFRWKNRGFAIPLSTNLFFLLDVWRPIGHESAVEIFQ